MLTNLAYSSILHCPFCLIFCLVSPLHFFELLDHLCQSRFGSSRILPVLFKKRIAAIQLQISPYPVIIYTDS